MSIDVEEGRTTFEETPENLAAEEAAFLESFGGTDAEPDTKLEDEPGEGQAAPPPVAPYVAPAEPELTMKDLRALIEEVKNRSIDTASRLGGQLGSTKQKLDAMEQELTRIRTTAKGISPRAKERISTDFPELAEMLFDEGDPEPIQQVTAPPVTTSRNEPTPQELEEAKEILAYDHPDWVQKVQSQEFKQWSETLPQAVRNRLINSVDPMFVSHHLTKFSAFQAQRAQEAAKSTQQQQNKQARLAAAVTPQGVPRGTFTGQNADDEESAMLAAFGRK